MPSPIGQLRCRQPFAVFSQKTSLSAIIDQARRHQVERRPPAAIAAFDDRMAHVEVVADGRRIERVDDRREVPHRIRRCSRRDCESRGACRTAALRRGEARATRSRRHRAPCACRRTRIGSSPRLKNGIFKRRGGLERRPRRRIGVGEELRRDQRHREPFLPDARDERRQIRGDARGIDVTSRAHREIDAVESQRLQRAAEIAARP